MSRLIEGTEFSPEAVKGLGYVRQKQVRGKTLGTRGFQEPHHPLWTLKPGWDTPGSQECPEAVPSSPRVLQHKQGLWWGRLLQRLCSPSKYSTTMRQQTFTSVPQALYTEGVKRKRTIWEQAISSFIISVGRESLKILRK